MLAMKAGPRKGSKRANQLFLLLPESTALASRVVVAVLESFTEEDLAGRLEDAMGEFYTKNRRERLRTLTFPAAGD